MKIKNIFNLSFEDSTKILLSRFWVKDYYTFDGTKKVTWANSNHNFFARFMFSFVFLGATIGIFGGGNLWFVKHASEYPIMGVNLQNTQIALNVVPYIKPILIGLEILVIIFGLIQILPPRNFAWYRIVGFTFFTFLVLECLIAWIPMGLGLMLQQWGKLTSILVLIFLGIFFIFYPINEWKKKIYKLTGRGKFVGYIQIFSILIAFLVFCLFLAFLTNPKNFISGAFLLILEILFYMVFYLCLDSLLTYYYILKYPKQYRVYYKIRDDAWWISTRKANKHEHVYPIPDKKMEKTNG